MKPKKHKPFVPKHTISTRIDLDTFFALRDYADAKGLSVSGVINLTLGQAAKKMTAWLKQTGEQQ